MIRGRSFRPLLPVAIVAVIGASCSHPIVNTENFRPVALPSTPTALPTFTPSQFDALLNSLRGKPVVVNVWASWCGPCIAEAPGLASLSKQYQGRVQFVGVDIQDQPQPARAFIKKYGWTYPSVADPTGAIRNSLGLVGQPVTIVFDATGKRVYVAPGVISEKTLRGQLEKLA